MKLSKQSSLIFLYIFHHLRIESFQSTSKLNYLSSNCGVGPHYPLSNITVIFTSCADDSTVELWRQGDTHQPLDSTATSPRNFMNSLNRPASLSRFADTAGVGLDKINTMAFYFRGRSSQKTEGFPRCKKMIFDWPVRFTRCKTPDGFQQTFSAPPNRSNT